ncbi:hypothetical protein A0J61_10658, partial [Choanephora cucurbitarum]
RTIQKYTNLSKSKSAPHKETDNYIERYNYFKTYNAQLNQQGLIPARRIKNSEFLDHPDDIDQVMPQLWERFAYQCLDQDINIAGVSIKCIEAAMKRYFGRLPNGIARLDNNQVKLTARVRLDDIARESSRSSQVSWYVGQVITYLVHKHGRRVYHLAVISLVEQSDMDEYGVPVVTCFANNEDKKIVVYDVKDIVTPVGFIRFNPNERQF